MSYILQHRFEPRRLDEQSQMNEFSLERELRNLDLKQAKVILDAGCGSGVLCRHLEETTENLVIHGCDISDYSLAHGKKHVRRKNTTLYRHDLLEKPTTHKYDVIVNRLVLHHLTGEEQRRMLHHFYLSLVPGGRLCVIDLDGLFVNLGTTDESLRQMMCFLQNKFKGELSSARYLPALFEEEGFKEIHWEIITMDFQGESRLKEVAQWESRFESSLSFYIDALGSETEARAFFRKYIEEASRPTTTLFYNKFVVQGLKAK